MPPFRYWLAPALAGLEIVALEKTNAISGGGISGLSIALFHFTSIPVGIWSMILKLAIFGIVLAFGGKRLALWTVIAAAMMSGWILLFELLHVQLALPVIAALPLIIVLSHIPSSLLLSAEYSTGGFTAVCQLLERRHIPVGVSYLCLNVLTLVLMTLAYGDISGAASTIAALMGAAMTEFWLRFFRRYLPVRVAARAVVLKES